MAEVEVTNVKESNWGEARKIRFNLTVGASLDTLSVTVPGYIAHWMVSGGNPGAGAGPAAGVVVRYGEADGVGAFTFSTSRTNIPVKLYVLAKK